LPLQRQLEVPFHDIANRALSRATAQGLCLRNFTAVGCART
jgi:hypothetical protein